MKRKSKEQKRFEEAMVALFHAPIIHLSTPSAESLKMVPTLTVNCFLESLQNQMRRVEMKECSVESQRG